MMDASLEKFYDVLSCRKSVREYADKEVEEEKLARILEQAHCAPSAANGQPCHFIVLKKTDRKEFDQVLSRESFKGAPVIILVCVDKSKAWVRRQDGINFAWVDAAIAVTEMVTAATAEGLGTCWVASFEVDAARKILGIPAQMEIVTLLTIGYTIAPLVKEVKNRKPLDAIVHYHKW